MVPLDPTQFVFVDETSTSIALTRRSARAPRGERVGGQVPRNYGQPTTLIAALPPTGLGAAMTLSGAANPAAFTAYVRELLGPSLRPGQIVLLDNVRFHHAAPLRELIEARGCRLLCLPPYSPDFTPIEQASSKVKSALRAAAARTQDDLDAAITAPLDRVTVADARAWFSHCGHRLPAQ